MDLATFAIVFGGATGVLALAGLTGLGISRILTRRSRREQKEPSIAGINDETIRRQNLMVKRHPWAGQGYCRRCGQGLERQEFVPDGLAFNAITGETTPPKYIFMSCPKLGVGTGYGSLIWGFNMARQPDVDHDWWVHPA